MNGAEGTGRKGGDSYPEVCEWRSV